MITKLCNICLALFSPYAYELDNYLDYDITKFKDNIRFLEVLINRDGNSNGIIALYFDGAVNYFNELPRASDKSGLSKVYGYLNLIRGASSPLFFMVSHDNKKQKNLHRWNLNNIFARLFN